MMEILGYSVLVRIAHSPPISIFTGIRHQDNCPVIIKLLAVEFPTALQLARFRHEYHLVGRLDHPGVIKVHALERVNHSLAIVMEDFGGLPLRTVIAENRLGLAEKVRVGHTIAAILGDIHADGIVHKDINPNNILIDPTSLRVKIIDFGSASDLPHAESQIELPDQLVGTLAYIAPEQTGRMNRPVDYRSDFYSLGVTLYELVLGQPPFAESDSLELIHRHMAAVPPNLLSRDPSLPPALSKIIGKLMEKSAEHRYQSAIGLCRDLDECLDAREDFVPGRHDASSRFTLPATLYGRDAEITRLFAAHADACDGRAGLVLVKGPSGIGKSKLIQEIHRSVAERSGFFIAGKYDQFQRNTPYSSLIQAFQALLHQVLAGSDAEIARWRTRLLDALGGNAQVIVEVLPELRHVIGPQPDILPLAPQEAQTRFTLCFVDFIRVFAEPGRPLVLFLDDLQWADNPSLSLLDSLCTNAACRHLLVIGAYRSNEVADGHPLLLALARLRQAGARVDEIDLQSLSPDWVCAFVAATVNRCQGDTAPLAALIAHKTDGNPFFIGQLLKSLHADGLIAYDIAACAWTWDLAGIERVAISDNVAELMSVNIRKLPATTRQLLELAACIGNEFTLHDLSVVGEQSWDSIAAHFREALLADLVAPIGDEYRFYGGNGLAEPGQFVVRYRFVHDRIQQAAYDLLDADAKARTHFKAGLLLSDTHADALDEKIFSIVNHFNKSTALACDPELRLRLAGLNLKGAIKAKNSIAYEPALRYVRAARAFLGDLAAPDLLMAILLEQAECEYLNGDGGQAEILYRQALDCAQGDGEQAVVFEAMIHFHTNSGNFRAAYDTGRQALRLFGIAMPAAFSPALFVVDFLRAKWLMRGKSVEDLVSLPLCRDARLVTAMRLIGALLKAAYQIRPELCIASAVKAVNLSLVHGTTEDNAVAYVVFGGIFIGGVTGNRQAGYEFGKLALAMNSRFGNLKQRSEINFVSAYFTNFWVEPAANTEAYYRAAYECGLQTGDFFHLSCAACTLVESQFIRGVPLNEIRALAETYLTFMERIKSTEAGGAISAVLHTAEHHFLHALILCAHGGRTKLGKARRILKKIERWAQLNPANFEHKAQLIRAEIARASGDEWSAIAAYGKAIEAADKNGFLQGKALAHERAGRFFASRAMDTAARAHLREAYYDYHLWGADGIAGRLAQDFPFVASQAVLESGRPDASTRISHGRIRRQASSGTDNTNKKASLDLETVIKATRAMSSEIKLATLLQTLVTIMIENAGAERGCFIRLDRGAFVLEADRTVGGVDAPGGGPVDPATLPLSVIQYVARVGDSVLINDAQDDERFRKDAYITAKKPKSILCAPVIRQGKVTAVIYLENNLTSDAFTSERFELLKILSAQAAISLENSLLYENLEHRVQERTIELVQATEQLRDANEALEKLTYTDALTQVSNKRHFDLVYDEEWKRATRAGTPLTVIMIDIDHFKLFNDTYGHVIGDTCLRQVASQLATAIARAGDLLARFGGEEFAVTLPNTRVEDAAVIASRLVESIRALAIPHQSSLTSDRVTISVGIATVIPDQAMKPMALIGAADKALYRAKATGRNRFCTVEEMVD
jgi:diguanylate cyclase (GGDEF)-like protein